MVPKPRFIILEAGHRLLGHPMYDSHWGSAYALPCSSVEDTRPVWTDSRRTNRSGQTHSGNPTIVSFIGYFGSASRALRVDVDKSSVNVIWCRIGSTSCHVRRRF